MSITVLPYVRVDGVPTFRDSEIKGLYQIMERDRTAEIVFCNGIVKNKEDFFNYISKPETVLYVALDAKAGDVPLGIGWINNFENRTARAHFCIFAEGRSRSVEAGKALVQRASKFGDLEMLIGMIPATNEKAIHFGQKCGATLACILPKGSCCEGFESGPTAVLYYLRNGV